MKKSTTIILATVLSAIMYFGNTAQTVTASSNDGILTDTTKKEKKITAISDSAITDTTKSK